MPVTPTYPGIYIQEAPASSHTIVAAPTNVAVFIGYTHPLKTLPANLNQAVQIFGYSDYTAQFGSFLRSAAFTHAYGPAGNPGAFGDMAQAVNQFFLNGGTTAYIVALNNNELASLTSSMVTLSGGNLAQATSPAASGMTFTATEVTDELYAMAITIRPILPSDPPGDPLADIIITYGPAIPPPQPNSPPSSPPSSPPNSPSPLIASGPGAVIETFRRVSLNQYQPDGKAANPNYILKRLGASALVTVSIGSAPGTWPAATKMQMFANYLPQATKFYNPSDFSAVLKEDTALDKVPVFNLMILPGIADNSGVTSSDGSGALILSAAIAFCERKRAFLIMDPPVADSADGTVPAGSHMIQQTMNQGSLPESKNAALYFPYLLSPDPISGSTTNYVTNQPCEIPPAATVAGIYSATDLSRGVWKAPAGFQAVTNNVTGVVPRGVMTDQRQGTLNPLGVNCLRLFPNIPTIVFGARTLATQTEEQWRYVPVRRMALFLEQTLYANLKWVIFEPNDQPLWTAIRNSIEPSMLGLFRQGACQGATPSQAFQVKCDGQTTTQDDINNGVVNIVV